MRISDQIACNEENSAFRKIYEINKFINHATIIIDQYYK